jgi:SAM-dependent methyltransferase
MKSFTVGTQAIRRFRHVIRQYTYAWLAPQKLRRSAGNWQQSAIDRYFAEGRPPWTEGYFYFKERLLEQLVTDADLLERFRTDSQLPDEYCVGVDERVIEYPWIMSQLHDSGGRLLDAGSALNHEYLLEHDLIRNRHTLLYTLSPETYSLARDNVSYVYGDLRETVLRDNCFDVVTCVSTLEHVGMDNTLLYIKQERFHECDLDAHLAAVKEIRRVLKPGGIALITVPFGKAENHGWLQQFDLAGVERIIDAFDGRVDRRQFYRYLPAGWIRADAGECAASEYFNVHTQQHANADNAAAARAVACLRLSKPAGVL